MNVASAFVAWHAGSTESDAQDESREPRTRKFVCPGDGGVLPQTLISTSSSFRKLLWQKLQMALFMVRAHRLGHIPSRPPAASSPSPFINLPSSATLNITTDFHHSRAHTHTHISTTSIPSCIISIISSHEVDHDALVAGTREFAQRPVRMSARGLHDRQQRGGRQRLRVNG